MCFLVATSAQSVLRGKALGVVASQLQPGTHFLGLRLSSKLSCSQGRAAHEAERGASFLIGSLHLHSPLLTQTSSLDPGPPSYRPLGKALRYSRLDSGVSFECQGCWCGRPPSEASSGLALVARVCR